jgi:hypothetical protein
MSIIFILLTLLGLLFAIIIILGYFLPTAWQVEKAVLVQAEAEDIFPFINILKNWQDWSVWNSDNNMEFEFEGPASGNNAVQIWKGTQINGKLTITKSEPNHLLEFNLELEHGRFVVKGIIVLESTMPSYTQVAWRSALNMPQNFNPIYRYQAFFLRNYFESSMQESLLGLQSLFGSSEEETETL